MEASKGGTLQLRKIARRNKHQRNITWSASSPSLSLPLLNMMSRARSCDKKNDENDNCRGVANSAVGKPTETACDGSSSFTLLSESTKERNLAGLLRLPDIDDTSMAHVFEYIEHYEEDLFWSFLSDSLFIVGGIVYMILSVWDYVGSEDDVLFYKALMIMGPLVYLVNSIVDILWANQVSRREKVRKRMQAIWAESVAAANTTEADDIDESNTEAEAIPVERASTWRLCKEALCEPLRKIQRHAAHRRTVLAAISFGLAALAAFVGVIVDYSDEGSDGRVVDVCNMFSVNMYLVSAIISVTGKRTRPWLAHRSCLGNHETLEDLGDLFFFIGSLVDCISADFALDSQTSIEPMFSAFLWLLDACFYLLSDFVMAEKLGKHYQAGSYEEKNEGENDFIGNSNVIT